MWFQVTGECMAPLLRKGDIVLTTTASKVEVGDIVVIESSSPAVHRVVKMSQNGSLVTKGDNSLSLDPPITRVNLKGKVIAIVRKNGKPIYIQGRLWGVKNHMMAGYSIVCYSIGRLLFRSTLTTRIYHRFSGSLRHIHIFVSTAITRFASTRSR